MNEAASRLGFLRELTWDRILLVVAVLVGCRLLILLVRRIVRRAAESGPSHRRLVILRMAPIARLLIGIAGIAIIVPTLVEPTLGDIIALIATVGLALAFALKDYVSCLIAGVVTIVENTYQPGDWIELDGAYGEVKAIGTRAVHLVTADDTEVIIPHARLWATSVFNASGGKQTLLCVTSFYLDADHDGAAVCQALRDDDRAIVRAASAASKAADYLLVFRADEDERVARQVSPRRPRRRRARGPPAFRDGSKGRGRGFRPVRRGELPCTRPKASTSTLTMPT